MNKLTPRQKRFLCEQLGSGATVLEACRMFYEEFKFQITLQQVMTYNPTRASGARLSAPLRKIFFDARARVANSAALEICEMNHAAIRQRRLDDLYHEIATLKWAQGQPLNVKQALSIIEASRRNEMTVKAMAVAPSAGMLFKLVHDPLDDDDPIKQNYS